MCCVKLFSLQNKCKSVNEVRVLAYVFAYNTVINNMSFKWDHLFITSIYVHLTTRFRNLEQSN